MRELIDSIRGEYERYKALGEGAARQVQDEELSLPGPNDSTSLAIICWHLSGNLRSRFTDFLTSDGEKPWRNREEEFDDRAVSAPRSWPSGSRAGPRSSPRSTA